MVLTGQTFDLDPKTFTLANMFAMQLHKYKEEIAKVTSSALKELTIENELNKLAESWKEQRFDLHKYTAVRCCCQAIDRQAVLQMLCQDCNCHLRHWCGPIACCSCLRSVFAKHHTRRDADTVLLWLLCSCRMALTGAGR
jgi:hypothetical protein